MPATIAHSGQAWAWAGESRVPQVPRCLHHLPHAEALRLDRAIMELRGEGLSHPALAVVLDLYEGVSVTAEEVRSWLHRLGAPALRGSGGRSHT